MNNSTQNILLGVCGGIAAYKSAELLRLLNKAGYTVRVVMTNAAQQFITPLTFEALSNQPVYSDLFDAQSSAAMDHIELARWADRIIIAPASANCIAKLRAGIADDLLSTICLASSAPIALAPAMNQQMWENQATCDNIKVLANRGFTLYGPDNGAQACGDTGAGRMMEPEALLEMIVASNQAQVFDGIKVLISAGPTREAIDPARFISNHSSGKMGYALAQAAIQAGASVSLISGPVSLNPPKLATISHVESAEQMYQAIMQQIDQHHIYIGCAAVADYAPLSIATSKIKKQAGEMTLVLKKTTDILATVAATKPDLFTVGFAAETDNLEQYALGKLKNKKIDMIIANQIGKPDSGFHSDSNAAHVFWSNGSKAFPLTNKSILAQQLIKLIAERYAYNTSS